MGVRFTLIKREANRLLVLECKILRTSFRPCRNEITGQWRRRQNQELHARYGNEIIVRHIAKDGQDMS